MRALLRGRPGLWLSVAALALVVAVTAAFLAAAARPSAPRSQGHAPMASAARTATPSPSPVSAASGPPAAVCINVADWSLDRRLDQLLLVFGAFDDLGASASEARAGVGGFVLFGQPAAGAATAISVGLAALRADASDAGQVAPWISTDEEGGSVQRLSNITGALISPRQMGTRWTPAQIQAALTAHAAALRALGIDVDLAPVLDVAAPDDTVADEAERAFSADPAVVAADGLAYAAGLEGGGLVPVVKHFPGLGRANANTDLAPATDPALAQLELVDLKPFEAAIAAGIRVIMISHVRVPGLTGGLPASLSSASYQLLRNTLGYQGVTVTDALDAVAISAAGYTIPAAAAAALEAGADLAMVPTSAWQPTLAALRQALASGSFTEAALDTAVGRVLTAKGLPVCLGTTQ